MNKDTLGDRMKAYEKVQNHVLSPRTPIIIRVDGKAFHTFTRGLEAFDSSLMAMMDKAATEICKQVSGAQIAYVQSDEISILLHYYKRFNSQPYFNNELQKICSVTASIAAATATMESASVFGKVKPAVFDSRVFTLPEDEVCNYFLWRQQDWTRNSVQMLARSMFSHKECNNKNNSELQDMCLAKGKNWNDLPASHKHGRCVVHTEGLGWHVDQEIPVFSQDRDYINKLLVREEG